VVWIRVSTSAHNLKKGGGLLKNYQNSLRLALKMTFPNMHIKEKGSSLAVFMVILTVTNKKGQESRDAIGRIWITAARSLRNMPN